MDDIQAQALRDQIEAAYHDNSPEADLLFEILLDRAINLMSHDQYTLLYLDLDWNLEAPHSTHTRHPWRAGAHARKHAHTHARTHFYTHTRTHARTQHSETS